MRSSVYTHVCTSVYLSLCACTQHEALLHVCCLRAWTLLVNVLPCPPSPAVASAAASAMRAPFCFLCEVVLCY